MFNAINNAYAKFARKPPVPPDGAGTLMYDSVTLSAIPGNAAAVAGYVDGYWPTFPDVQKGWPHAHHLSIAVTAKADADCLDVEQGDASPAQAPAWVKRQLRRGVARPVVYSSVSQMPAVLAALKRSHVPRSRVRVWTAHYTGKPHRCTAACGFGFDGVADATQYDNRAFRRNLDVSLCAPGFFTPPSKVQAKKAGSSPAHTGSVSTKKGVVRYVIPPGTEKAA